MKLVLFLTFVVALTFVIDGSQMVQAEGEDDDPVLDSFKHCRKLCHSLQTFVSYFSNRFKDGKGYAACFATCELQLEEAKSKRHPYLYSCQLVLNTVRKITLILNNSFLLFSEKYPSGDHPSRLRFSLNILKDLYDIYIRYFSERI